jgi:hypothetical protein
MTSSVWCLPPLLLDRPGIDMWILAVPITRAAACEAALHHLAVNPYLLGVGNSPSGRRRLLGPELFVVLSHGGRNASSWMVRRCTTHRETADLSFDLQVRRQVWGGVAIVSADRLLVMLVEDPTCKRFWMNPSRKKQRTYDH